MANADKRIPVTEERWEELHSLKGPGQTYDDLLAELVEKSQRIVRGNLAKLAEPYPGEGQGDEERITWRDQEVYRLPIGRTWTAFYDVEENDEVVKGSV